MPTDAQALMKTLIRAQYNYVFEKTEEKEQSTRAQVTTEYIHEVMHQMYPTLNSIEISEMGLKAAVEVKEERE